MTGYLCSRSNLCGAAFRDGEDYRRLPCHLTKIAKGEKIAILAVVLVMMLFFEMARALQTVVVGINGIMMHVYRRQRHCWQIYGQQQDGNYMPHCMVSHSGMQNYTFFEKHHIKPLLFQKKILSLHRKTCQSGGHALALQTAALSGLNVVNNQHSKR